MPTPDGWRALIVAASRQRNPPVTAHTFLGDWGTASHPVLLSCNDGRDYVVKGSQVRKRTFNDHVVARVGSLILAPVSEVGYVDVPQALITAEPKLGHMAAGISHGSVWIPDCSEREGLLHFTGQQNKDRFARLSVLYGWTQASDLQFIYEKASPNLVVSVDHGHFLPKDGEWQIPDLQSAPPAVPDNAITVGCQLTGQNVDNACSVLRAVTANQIAEIVAGPMDHWGVSMAERIAVAIYLERRQQELLAGMPY